MSITTITNNKILKDPSTPISLLPAKCREEMG
jgi:hypothetical protein